MTVPTAVFVIDPPERLDLPTDTSLVLMRAAVESGLRVVYTTLGNLRIAAGRPHARVRPIFFAVGEELFRAGEEEELDLTEAGVTFMRKDPPVDVAYLQGCAILAQLPSEVVQVNPARALLLHGEKMIPFYFPGLIPETVVTASPADLLAFLDAKGKIVVKPLDDCSGRGIFTLDRGAADAVARLSAATDGGRRFVQGQIYLPEIVDGDKRVLLLGGEILGAIRRVPAPGEFRSNINAGGRCVPCELSARDRAICARLRPWLVAEQIHFAGVDIVGEYVLEVNITSPSCLREMNALMGAALEDEVLAYILRLRKA